VAAPAVERHDGEARVVMARVARTFDLATRLLPAPVRRDVRRLYLVLRTLDDVVDTGSPDALARIEAVETWVTAGTVAGREAELLDDLGRRHPGFPRDAVADFCAGMRADLAGPWHATEADLDRYCYQVAGTVGRLMAPLLGVRPGREADADAAARALGGAMQRTNILRDLREDAGMGRVYLSADALAAVDVDAADQAGAAAAIAGLPGWDAARRRALLAPQIARADEDYAAGLAGVGALLRGRRGIRAAGLMYRGILREIERDGYGASGDRAVVGRGRKARIIIATLIGG
jgi:15-cis-phytoene synthase